MNRNFYKKMKNYKEIKEFSQNKYIRIADMNGLSKVPNLTMEVRIKWMK